MAPEHDDRPSRRVGDSHGVEMGGQGGASHPDPAPSSFLLLSTQIAHSAAMLDEALRGIDPAANADAYACVEQVRDSLTRLGASLPITTHVPACNDRCDGNTHYLRGGS